MTVGGAAVAFDHILRHTSVSALGSCQRAADGGFFFFLLLLLFLKVAKQVSRVSLEFETNSACATVEAPRVSLGGENRVLSSAPLNKRATSVWQWFWARCENVAFYLESPRVKRKVKKRTVANVAMSTDIRAKWSITSMPPGATSVTNLHAQQRCVWVISESDSNAVLSGDACARACKPTVTGVGAEAPLLPLN